MKYKYLNIKVVCFTCIYKKKIVRVLKRLKINKLQKKCNKNMK